MTILPLGPQEPPNDPMIYNRRQADGTFRRLVGFWEREAEMKTPTEEKPSARDTKTIAGKFAEALGCLEDALCYLHQVNEHYEEQVIAQYESGPHPCNPAMDFWLQTEKAEDGLHEILHRLQHVPPFAPKEKFTTQAADATAYTKQRSMP